MTTNCGSTRLRSVTKLDADRARRLPIVELHERVARPARRLCTVEFEVHGRIHDRSSDRQDDDSARIDILVDGLWALVSNALLHIV
jgi:hypothetical protein